MTSGGTATCSRPKGWPPCGPGGVEGGARFVRGGVGDADDAAIVGRLLRGKVIGYVAVGGVAAVETRQTSLGHRHAQRRRRAADEDARVGGGGRALADHGDGKR